MSAIRLQYCSTLFEYISLLYHNIVIIQFEELNFTTMVSN